MINGPVPHASMARAFKTRLRCSSTSRPALGRYSSSKLSDNPRAEGSVSHLMRRQTQQLRRTDEMNEKHNLRAPSEFGRALDERIDDIRQEGPHVHGKVGVKRKHNFPCALVGCLHYLHAASPPFAQDRRLSC